MMPKPRVSLFIQNLPNLAAKEFKATARGELGTATVRVCVDHERLPQIDDLDLASEISAEATRMAGDIGSCRLEPASGMPGTYFGDGILFTDPGTPHTHILAPTPRWLR